MQLIMIMLMLSRGRVLGGYSCLAVCIGGVSDLFHLLLMSGVYLMFCHYILCGGLNCQRRCSVVVVVAFLPDGIFR
jgi:hypothetical protein